MAADELYSTQSREGVLVLTFLPGAVLDAMAIDRASAGVKELIRSAPETHFLFDLQHVPYLSSSALGMLIGLHRRIVQRQGRLKLAGIGPQVMEVFRMTRLDSAFNIYDNCASAVEAFRKGQ
jgi:anti-sigma B factor antagonist